MLKFSVYLGLHLGDQLFKSLRSVGTIMGGMHLLGPLLLVLSLVGASDQLLDRL